MKLNASPTSISSPLTRSGVPSLASGVDVDADDTDGGANVGFGGVYFGVAVVGLGTVAVVVVVVGRGAVVVVLGIVVIVGVFGAVVVGYDGPSVVVGEPKIRAISRDDGA